MEMQFSWGLWIHPLWSELFFFKSDLSITYFFVFVSCSSTHLISSVRKRLKFAPAGWTGGSMSRATGYRLHHPRLPRRRLWRPKGRGMSSADAMASNSRRWSTTRRYRRSQWTKLTSSTGPWGPRPSGLRLSGEKCEGKWKTRACYVHTYFIRNTLFFNC